MLLSNYDTWLKTLVETRTPSPAKQDLSAGLGHHEPGISPAMSYATATPQDTAYLPSRNKSTTLDMASDIQSYSEKLDRMFDGRKSYAR